jgi:hypothetical protein
MSRNSPKLSAAAASLLVAAVVLLPQGEAIAAGTDPNLTRGFSNSSGSPRQAICCLTKPKKHPKSEPKDAKS